MYEAKQNKEKVSRRIAINKVAQKQAEIQLNYGKNSSIYGYSGNKDRTESIIEATANTKKIFEKVQQKEINKDGSMRSKYQCAEPNAIAELIEESRKGQIAPDDLNNNFNFQGGARVISNDENDSSDDINKAMWPCEVCNQWVKVKVDKSKSPTVNIQLPSDIRNAVYSDIKQINNEINNEINKQNEKELGDVYSLSHRDVHFPSLTKASEQNLYKKK